MPAPHEQPHQEVSGPAQELTGRLLAIGDIHGCLKSLRSLAEYVGFTQDDTIVTLGDYIDRGPDSKGVISFLIDLKSTQTVHCLRGNHEIILERSLTNPSTHDAWNTPQVGGGSTLHSYQIATLHQFPEDHLNFIHHLLPYHETEDHIFVHAGLKPDLPLSEQTEASLFWDRPPAKPQAHLSGKTVVFGHTPQSSGTPLNHRHTIGIDTHAYGGGWLTCLDVHTGQYWQSNEVGHKRTAFLHP